MKTLWKRFCLWMAQLEPYEREGIKRARISEYQRLEMRAYDLTHVQSKGDSKERIDASRKADEIKATLAA